MNPAVLYALAHLYGYTEPTVRYDLRNPPERHKSRKPTQNGRAFTNRVARRRARKGYA